MAQEDTEQGTQSEYKISVVGPGTSLERTVPDEVFRQVLVLLYGPPSARPTLPPQTGAPPTAPAGKATAALASPVSLREFLNQHAANTNMKIIAAVGAYKKNYAATDKFTPEELTKEITDAGEPAPANLGRDIKKTIRAGWIARKPGNDDIYYVTGSGEKAVTASFQEATKGPRRRRRVRRRTSTKQSP